MNKTMKIISDAVAMPGPPVGARVTAALAFAGYVIVPREPTEAMMAIGFAIEDDRYAAHRPQEDRCAGDIWAAMINEAQKE